MLLSTEGTPADYLLAICKSFGLYILTDGATKTARIVRRSTLYQNEIIDLTERVDTSRPVEIQPLAIEAKYYDWKHQDVGASFGKEYKETSGRDYGAQRVNTGYDFDAKALDVLAGVVLKGTAAVVKSSRYLAYKDGTPAVFMANGVSFTSWDGSGNGEETDIPSANPSDFAPYNNGQDIVERAQFEAKDGKPVDGADVLLLAENYFGITEFSRLDDFLLTDDVPDMDTIAGKPCWLLTQKIENLLTPSVLASSYMNGGEFHQLSGFRVNYYPVEAGKKYRIVCEGFLSYISLTAIGFSTAVPVNGGSNVVVLQSTAQTTTPIDYVYTAGADGYLCTQNSVNDKPVYCYEIVTSTPLPHFSRYVLRTIFPDPLLPGETSVWRALDFGIPAELDIPNITYDQGTIYEQAWKRYVADRLSVDTKILRCRVRLDGLQVGQDLLRKFYWYRGALWTLNKIENYSLTTFDLAECEFVQVQDIDAYLNG